MKKIVFIISITLLIAARLSAQSIHHVCQDCPLPDVFTTITAAIAAAEPGDIIDIWGETDMRIGASIIEYSEQLVIDKQLTLVCRHPDLDLGNPIITHDFAGGTPDSVIIIKPGAEGTVIKNLIIRGPKTGPVTDCDSELPFDCMKTKSGIRIFADNCLVEGCEVTRCMTGIYITGMGNTIRNNKIGLPWYGVIEGHWCLSEEWQPTIGKHQIDHTGNGFGIVAIEPLTKKKVSSETIRAPNHFQDNIFRGNRYTEFVEVQ